MKTPLRRPLRTALSLAVSQALLCCPLAAGAGAVTDGSVGPVQSLAGRFTVPQSLGTVKGANLFHSFARFSLTSSESATFTTTDAGIRNVISRVTGGEASTLQGLLELKAAGGSRPEFFFVNPSGITVAAGAVFDVPAGLHLSTAPQLKFADGFVWDTRSANPSSLTVAAPESFGFLGTPATALRVQGANLAVSDGSALELAGGDVSLENAAVLFAVGGSVRVQALGHLTMTDGAGVVVLSNDGSTPGSVRIEAASLAIDGHGLESGIIASAMGSRPGPTVDVRVAGALTVANAGEIFSSNTAAGAGGRLSVDAGSLALDAQGSFAIIGSQAFAASTAPAGAVTVRVRDAATLRAGALVSSSGSSGGAAGRVDLSAGSMLLDAQHGTAATGVQSNGGSALNVNVAGTLDIRNGAGITSASAATQPVAALQVQAARVRIDGGGDSYSQIGSLSSNPSPSAPVQVQATESVQITRGGQISSGTLGSGHAGSVQVSAPVIEMTGGGQYVTVISSSSLGRQGGNAGALSIDAGRLELRAGASIYADTFADQGSAGRVTVRADKLTLDGGGKATGITSMAYGRNSDAGSVTLDVREELVVRDGASIMAGTLGTGSAGKVSVQAASLLIDGTLAGGSFTGIAGDTLGGGGVGAEVAVSARRIDLRSGGTISTSTATQSDAGSLLVSADVLNLDGGDRSSSTSISADSVGLGRAGNLTIRARELKLSNEALISSSTFLGGPGGSINIEATQFTAESGAGVFTVTAGGGAAGNIDLKVAEALVLRSGGALSANTGGAGAAGRIQIEAGSFLATGSDAASGFRSTVISRARLGSGGQPGSITLKVRDNFELQDGAALSIANDAQVARAGALLPGSIQVQAGRIALADGDITASASLNANAGRIALSSGGAVVLDASSVRTSSRDGDGGAITVDAAGTVRLRDSRITSSVEGRNNGNGGDIGLAARTLLLESGFVQANTAAALARGGNVAVEVAALVPNGSNVFIGGNRIESFRPGVPGFNVIQAAAPDGLSGTLAVTIPQLNLSGSLVGLNTPWIDFGPLGRDLCQVGTESSLTVLGRGALPAPAAAPLRIVP